MNKPSLEDAQYVFELRCRSKRGERLTPEEATYCKQMYKEYPEWYTSLNPLVFEHAKPFGSS